MSKSADQEPNINPVFSEPVRGLMTTHQLAWPFESIVFMHRTLWGVRDTVRRAPDDYLHGYRELRNVVLRAIDDTIREDGIGDDTLHMIRALRRSTHPPDRLLGAYALGTRDAMYTWHNRPQPEPSLEEDEWRRFLEAESDPDMQGRMYAELDISHQWLRYRMQGRPHLRPLVERLEVVMADYETCRAMGYTAMIAMKYDHLNQPHT